MSIEIYEIEPGRWGYRVDAVVQEWNPEVEGFVPMSQAEAQAFARRLASEMNVAEPGITKLAFMERFTDAELVAIYSAAKQSAAVEVWLEKLKMTTGNIVLTDIRTISGVRGLEAAGLIAVGRAAEILK